MSGEPHIQFDARLLIDGSLVDTDRHYANIDPYSEKVLGYTPEATLVDTQAAIVAARRAFDRTRWRTDHDFRATCLMQLHDGLLRRVEELRTILVSESGCPIFMTRGQQLDLAIAEIVNWSAMARQYAYESYLSPTAGPSGTSERLVLREPIGVGALIAPYNYPVNMLITKLGPALAAGNTVVLKPSPHTPWTAAFIGEVAALETDIPAGVFNVITGSGTDVSSVMVEHPLVDFVHFTGSTEVGRRIMANAAGTVKKVILELGGKSAHIVLDDADIEAAVRFTVARMSRHSGQGCTNLTRLLLPRRHFDGALEVAAEAAAEVVWGDPMSERTHMGPQISEKSRQRVLGAIDRAVGEGGRLIAGGAAPDSKGFFVEATVIADVSPKSALAQEELFAPVLAVLSYEDDDEAVAIANDSIYGLSGAVTGGSDRRALEVARRVTTGTMDVNNATWFAPDSPFGGLKQSGLGTDWGVYGLEECLQTRIIGHPPLS
ncbi:aldehyde dehydrogenase family protein [Mycolicibacterium vinylchloridicum]|uniref:aldehyde dehydrogenase family protein n=1 Tax=Mycolicibacterium vinylchloridicum TaxID=2736928 RepID=UPI0015C6A44E|nr:aldehyde dehydrogenase family protein [Mycolicibacterium vinylchloridicum]